MQFYYFIAMQLCIVKRIQFSKIKLNTEGYVIGHGLYEWLDRLNRELIADWAGKSQWQSK